ncbi:FecR family protein [Flexithrix dorotheae]|uniref:FecR family protein n=1 Tax=Flexithrix dorotheae TaxID=70993 RepID=UPI000375345B|nr:FecR family protein [Flexithrix dorotheae]
MDYSKFDITDLIKDERFKSWVVNPTPEKDFYWESWLKNHPEKTEELATAKDFILSLNFQTHNVSEGRRKNLYENILRDSKKENNKVKNINQSAFSARISKYAAVLLPLILVGVFLFFYIRMNMAPVNKEIVWITKETQKGEKLNLKLADGSTVKLNSESKITFPEKFGNTREIALEGEAFFQVTRFESPRPFIVKTGDISTKVLGTSFNIDYQNNNQSVQVAVVTGKVAVEDKISATEVTLLPFEYVSFDQDGVVKGNYDFETILGWKDNILVLESAGLEEISKKLSCWFGYDFEIDPDLKVARKFSGKFKDKSLIEVLEGISYASNIDFEIDKKNNKVFIISKNN